MPTEIMDRKNKWAYAMFSIINSIAVRHHFRSVDVAGRENLPSNGPFLLVANHISRWDGLVIYHLLGRPANFMVSPNELKGLQGYLLRLMGAFPASLKFDLQSYIRKLASQSEAIVVFPEGDIYKDGFTHSFKSGTARFALQCARDGVKIPVIPVAIRYSNDGRLASLVVSSPVVVDDYLGRFSEQPTITIKALTERLYREICHLRLALGVELERAALFSAKTSKSWASSMSGTLASINDQG